MNTPRIILAFDTAMFGCNVALWDSGKNICVKQSETMERGQAEKLVPMIQSIVKQAGFEMADIDLIGTAIGPGGFTGLRIGLSTARALGLALSKPVVGLTTLEILARDFLNHEKLVADEQLAVLIETKRQDFYIQYFDAQGETLSEPAGLTADVIAEEVGNRKIVFIGDALARFLSLVEKRPLWRMVDGCNLPDPEVMARLALERYNAGNVKLAEPLYLRNADVTVSKKPVRLVE